MIRILIGIAGFIPIPRVYKDGGTVELVALWYRYTRWHFLDSDLFAPYREEPEFSCYYKDGYWGGQTSICFHKTWNLMVFLSCKVI